MKRPTIPDLARAAGVSVSTVNRVIHDPESVRLPTRKRVQAAAESISFYGLGTIDHSVRQGQERHKLGILLQQQNRSFYRSLGEALKHEATRSPDGRVDLTIRHMDDASPDAVARLLIEVSKDCDSVALVGAQHPILADAIDEVLDRGVPVCGLIAPLSARGNVGFVGLDNWKVGRTAAWAFDRLTREPGRIGILVGNHRYRNQELNESGFRSYFREHNDRFTLLEPMSTYESAAVAREHVEHLIGTYPDLRGLFVSGGGITGAIAALRDLPRRKDFVTVGYELIDVTRSALIDGVLTLAIAHPMEAFAKETIATMIRAKRAGPEAGSQRSILNFEVYTSENV